MNTAHAINTIRKKITRLCQIGKQPKGQKQMELSRKDGRDEAGRKVTETENESVAAAFASFLSKDRCFSKINNPT